MAMSIFDDKSAEPTEKDLAEALGRTMDRWRDIMAYVIEKYPSAIEQWNFPGAKYGWSFRLKDKKRAIIYLIPCSKHFQAAFVFGDKAVAAVEASLLPESIKDELRQARKYAEGRGIRLPVKNKTDVKNIKKLIDIKLAH